MADLAILGIDGTNWVHVLWHALGGRDVVPTFAARVEALVRTLEPTACVVCFDRRSFRHGLLDGYKAGRKPKPQGLLDDLVAAESAATAVGTVAAEEGYEADDCLATLAATRRGRTILASADKDLRQCLWPGVSLLRSFRLVDGRPTAGNWYTARSLFDEHGLDRSQWVDFQTLVGDRSDGIDGAKGWGEKTAAAVLGRVRTLDACYANPWAVPCTDRQRAALREFQPRVDLVRSLVTLATSVDAVWDAMR